MTMTTVRDVPAQALKGRDALKPAWRSAGGYMSGFCNEFASEAIPGAMPTNQQYPQQAPFGLYSEEFSGSAFTAPREDNRRSWFYRLRPSANAPGFKPYSGAPLLRTGPFNEVPPNPNRLRMSPIAWPTEPTDFVDGLITLCGNGEPSAGAGVGIHQYLATKSMERIFFNADGEFLIVPQEGALQIFTECGLLEVDPGEFAIIPRGMRFRVELPDGRARGYICENYGHMVKLPELGPIGSFGLANKRHFMAPVAGFEDVDGPVDVIEKYQGGLWIATLDHSPLDVVAWHGNHAPYKFDLDLFMPINTVSYDHPDPSINTVMTSHSDTPGTANMDFVVFAPRWVVAEHSFRPPPFHRNVMSEFMGLIHGVYDAKAEGFVPGGVSLHNSMTPHGPDYGTYLKGIQAPQDPHKLDNTLAFMFETRAPLRPTRYMLECDALQKDYDAVWAGFPKAPIPPAR